jgi:SAM-dependent methyltransferase
MKQWMDRVFYPACRDNWDNEAFRQTILARLRPEHHVLDLGAGAGIVVETRFPGHVAKMCGVDPDPRIIDNPYLDEAHVGFGEKIPYDENTFDLVFSNNVLEHLENPADVFSEVARVLKPGGVFMTKTPNRRHYVPLIATCTPHWFHQWVNKLRGRDAEDTFPTLYRANCRKDQEHHGCTAGLPLSTLQFIEGRPEYLRMSAPTYLLGWMYERIVNSVSHFESFRCVMISEFQKPENVMISNRNVA